MANRRADCVVAARGPLGFRGHRGIAHSHAHFTPNPIEIMHPIPAPSRLSAAMQHNVSDCDKHCIVRSGTSWFSLPAHRVREITIAPELVAVPQCHSSLAGLCHLRSEFIPVIMLDALLEVEGIERGDAGRMREHNKLTVISGHRVWALLVAEAAAIHSLETLVTPETRMDEGHPSPIIGTAMFADKIVRVLDPNTIFRLAQQAMESHWRR